ncbi:MAG: fimbrillin family protein [Parabacteroides sp.]|nr:fimbrillin family protein [Parabacteroides sp.]
MAAEDGSLYNSSVPSLLFNQSGGGSWSSEQSVEIVENKAAKVYGGYPSDATLTDENKTPKIKAILRKGSDSDPVDAAEELDFLATKQADYLYSGLVNASSTNRAISLRMKHALTKVSFSIAKATDVSEKLTLTKLVIRSEGSKLQTGQDGRMLLTDGTLNALVATSSIVLTGETVLSAKQDNPNVTCLLAPMNSAESVLSFGLTVKVGEGADAVERTFNTASITPAVQWSAGKHYVYQITVNKMSGKLDGVKVEEWKNDASQNTQVGI